MPNDDIELAEVVRYLKEFHRASMVQDIEWDEAKIWSEEEADRWHNIYVEAKSKIVSARASSLYIIRLKAYAAEMIADLHNGGGSLDDAIIKANSFELVALSAVRDLLKYAA